MQSRRPIRRRARRTRSSCVEPASCASAPGRSVWVARSRVIDQLRLFLNRPLSDADRSRLFAIAVGLIVGTALVFALLDDAGPAAERTAGAIATRQPAEPALDSTPSATPTTAPLSEEGTPAPGENPARAEVVGAKRAARRFGGGSLPYTYARGRARDIRVAAAQLREHLGRARPRVPPAERHRHPRLVLVQSDVVSPSGARLVALVRDGKRRYSLALQLTRAHGRWRVARVGV